MSNTIVIKCGYTSLAIPYTPARAEALADIMLNCTPVNTDWYGNMTDATKPEDSKLSFNVVLQSIPVYVAPVLTETVTETEEN